MEKLLTMVLGVLQGAKLIPELTKVCKEKDVKIVSYSFNRITFIQGKLTAGLSGKDDAISYVLGWLAGYEKSFELNKPVMKKVSPPS